MAHFKTTLANEYAYATECDLATLSGYLLKKSSPKSEIGRQIRICLRMLLVCRTHKAEIEWSGGLQHHFHRVEKLIAEPDLEAALATWVEEHKR